jgi:hypothetical protein
MLPNGRLSRANVGPLLYVPNTCQMSLAELPHASPWFT